VVGLDSKFYFNHEKEKKNSIKKIKRKSVFQWKFCEKDIKEKAKKNVFTLSEL